MNRYTRIGVTRTTLIYHSLPRRMLGQPNKIYVLSTMLMYSTTIPFLSFILDTGSFVEKQAFQTLHSACWIVARAWNVFSGYSFRPFASPRDCFRGESEWLSRPLHPGVDHEHPISGQALANYAQRSEARPI